MATTDFDTVYKKLNTEVTRVAGPAPSTEQSSSSLTVSKLNLRPEYLYALIPVFLMILLIVFKPPFVTYPYLPEGADEDTVPEQKIAFKKVAVWAVGMTIPIGIGIYVYKYKQ